MNNSLKNIKSRSIPLPSVSVGESLDSPTETEGGVATHRRWGAPFGRTSRSDGATNTEYHPIHLGWDTLATLNNIYGKYKNLQDFYYNMYIESFNGYFYHDKFLKLYVNFKSLCRLLKKIKILVEYACFKDQAYQAPSRSDARPKGARVDEAVFFQSNFNISNCQSVEKDSVIVMLGAEEIKVLLAYKDIKLFLDRNNLYSIIDSNH